MPRTKTMTVTGGTSGIGLAGAREMAARGFRLILIGRNAERGREAIGSLPVQTQEPHRLITADLSLMSEIRSVITNLEATEPAIDVLANNAGTWFNRRELTSEGIERTVAINHLAYVALTLGLKHLLLNAQGARVINTGSFVYRHARYDPNNLQSQKRFSTNGTYAATKLYNFMFTRALARRWVGTGITINCFSPGFVATNFGRGEGGILESYYRFIRFFAISPEKAATTLVYLAESPEVSGISGAYYENCTVKKVSGDAADDEKAASLLDWSALTTGFNPAEL